MFFVGFLPNLYRDRNDNSIKLFVIQFFTIRYSLFATHYSLFFIPY